MAIEIVYCLDAENRLSARRMAILAVCPLRLVGFEISQQKMAAEFCAEESKSVALRSTPKSESEKGGRSHKILFSLVFASNFPFCKAPLYVSTVCFHCGTARLYFRVYFIV